MTKRNRISIALCTYNGARFLSEQLESFRRQQRLPDEVIVCDDGSTDGTVELLEAFAQTAPFTVHLHCNKENLGYSRNFQKAIGLCTGEIIALSDQDDVWHAHKLLRIAELFDLSPDTQGVFSDGDLIDLDSHLLRGTLWKSFRFLPEDQVRFTNGQAVQVLLQRNVVTGMAFAFRSSWAKAVSHMPTNWPHDFWLALMLAADNHLMPCPDRLVAYRVHPQQQIGVPISQAEKIAFVRKSGSGAYLDLSRKRNLREYSKDAEQFESLLAKAREDSLLAEAWWLPMAAEKAVHMRRGVDRLSMPRGRRWVSILRHWRDYLRYAPTGLSALIRDLLL